MGSISINRTSVELKLDSFYEILLCLLGINRTSVELKQAGTVQTEEGKVLIAPVWNWNYGNLNPLLNVY